jgi:hypothetical protein
MKKRKITGLKKPRLNPKFDIKRLKNNKKNKEALKDQIH